MHAHAAQRVRSDLLEIAYHRQGPRGGPPVLMLHGWPDDPRTWSAQAAALAGAGHDVVVPYLRGYGPTRFLSASTPRDGRALALVQDSLDLLDALDLRRVAVVGHDWGARTAYALAALFPERVSGVAALSVPWQPRGEFRLPDFAQARLFWYQWFMALDAGAEAVRRDPVGFARMMWQCWSPAGWFTQEEFAATARSFENPDFAAITLHSYRSRWLEQPRDPRYDGLHQRLAACERISVPALVIQGASDTCSGPAQTEHQGAYFSAAYRHLLLPGVGHFPSREAPAEVSEALLGFLLGAAG